MKTAEVPQIFELIVRGQVHNLTNGITHPLLAINAILEAYRSQTPSVPESRSQEGEALPGYVKSLINNQFYKVVRSDKMSFSGIQEMKGGSMVESIWLNAVPATKEDYEKFCNIAPTRSQGAGEGMSRKKLEEIVCRAYSGYCGEELDTPKQLVKSTFSGEELVDFCDVFIKHLSPSAPSASRPETKQAGE